MFSCYLVVMYLYDLYSTLKERKRRGETNNQLFLPDILAYQVTNNMRK